jgi:hypothetical protein
VQRVPQVIAAVAIAVLATGLALSIPSEQCFGQACVSYRVFDTPPASGGFIDSHWTTRLVIIGLGIVGSLITLGVSFGFVKSSPKDD